MDLKYDGQGFLVGELIDMSKDMLRGQEIGNELLRQINASLGGGGRPSRRPSSRTSAAPFMGPLPAVTATRSPTIATRSAVKAIGQAAAVAAVTAGGRDSRGRFVAGAGRSGPRPSASPGRSDPAAPGVPTPKTPKEEKEKGIAREVAIDLVKNATDNIDPTIQAAKEIKETLSPLGRGWKATFGKSEAQNKERWYKRLLKAITGNKGESSTSVSSRDGDGVLGGLGAGGMGMLTKILPALGAVLGPVLLVVMAGLAGLGIGKLISDWMDSSGVQTKLLDAIDSMKEAWGNFVDGASKRWGAVKDWSSKAVSSALDAGTSAIKSTTGVDVRSMSQGIKRVLGIDGTKRVYENADGSVESRQGGTVSWRNQNPGNLKFEYAGSADKTVKNTRTKAQALASAQSKYEGVVDLDQWGNAIFATEENGRAAQAKLLTGMHGPKTIEQMLPKYAITDASGKANIGAYANGIYGLADKRGLNLRGKTISSLSAVEMTALLDGMKSVEGYRAGAVDLKMPRAAVSAGIKIPRIGAMPQTSARSIPAMPELMSLSAQDSKDQPSFQMKSEVSQSVTDRGIAHIATGGMGAKS